MFISWQSFCLSFAYVLHCYRFLHQQSGNNNKGESDEEKLLKDAREQLKKIRESLEQNATPKEE